MTISMYQQNSEFAYFFQYGTMEHMVSNLDGQL